jgi:hypothetical protein
MYSWEKIAEHYGLKLRENFNILTDEYSFYNPYHFRANGLYNKDGEKVTRPILEIQKGNYEKEGETK